MNDQPTPESPEATGYVLNFLTDEWEWEEPVDMATLEVAVERAREGLESMVRAEASKFACVTLTSGGTKIGIWDWVEGRPYWTRL